MEIGREDKLEQLERILESRALHGSENLKSFLKFVVDKSLADSADQLKEYTIATEVFGRSNQFSPRNDSVVRVQASRLRSKLQEYYATEGKSDRVLIELPKGHYNPSFSATNRDKDDSSPIRKSLKGRNGGIGLALHLPPQQLAHDRWKGGIWIAGLGATLLVLIGVGLALVVWNGSLTERARIEKAGFVWEPFLKAEAQTLLVLSNPAVYRFTNPKDPEPLLKDSITLTPGQIKRIEETMGGKFMIRNSTGQLVPTADQFTGVGEAMGLHLITYLFGSTGREVHVKQSRTVSGEDLKSKNVIFLGSVWVNEWSGKPPVKEDFIYTPNATIENQNPQPGEEMEYTPKFDSAGRLIEDYALITVKPNISHKHTVMILAGIHSEGTQAAGEYAASPEYLNILNQRLLQFPKPPRHYQALLKVAVDNGIPTTISLIGIHELRPSAD
jgi:hypothetical protein